MFEFDNNKILSDAAACRDAVSDLVRLEMLGPLKTDSQITKEHELISNPTSIFSCGVIFPFGFVGEPSNEPNETIDDIEFNDLENSVYENQRDGRSQEKREIEDILVDDIEENSNELFVANQKNPCSFGVSFRTLQNAELEVDIYFAKYQPVKRQVDEKEKINYKRTEFIFHEIPIKVEKTARIQKIALKEDGLSLSYIINKDKLGYFHVSLWLINNKAVLSTSEIYRNCLFQPEISVKNNTDFVAIENDDDVGRDKDTRSNTLLYRNKKSYSKGHGCAGNWGLDEDGGCKRVFTDFFPTYEIMPILPVEEGPRFEGIDFSFYGNSVLDQSSSDEAENIKILDGLKRLTAAYENWIKDRKLESTQLSDKFSDIAAEHIKNCEIALERMKEGILFLSRNNNLMFAFRLANYAMFLQQLHGNNWRNSEGELDSLPSSDDEENRKKRKWRPFQLAFVLMNLSSLPLEEFNRKNRDLVDLIWFPTGGGKTEAYLGVAAVAICYSRLVSPDTAGTEVIMRYTLRLLTSQQFQRATLLILALEMMRKEGLFKNSAIKNSENRFSAGLWVGRDLTPNRKDDAKEKLKNLRNGNGKNAFALLSCPWCKKDLEQNNYAGYRYSSNSGFSFRCPEEKCYFYAQDLPINIIDEQLYEAPPTLLLSTVDKFALLPWYDGPTAFLGKKSGKPPALIIQDELHLISGPLGSVVGHYEDLIFNIMEEFGERPKIVASTATIRRAEEQVAGLYNRSVSAFPPQALNYDDSFFAVEACKPTENIENIPKAEGRRYIGVFASALKSHITAQRNLVASTLQFVNLFGKEFVNDIGKDENGRPKYELKSEIKENCKGLDPYGTLVWYFNSIRELGYADSLLSQDISQHTKNICIRYNIPYPLRRRNSNTKELTSRTKENEIFETLELLEKEWAIDFISKAVDVLLATSMISVGVDINRLGLMVINGQPKNTSEYIQASSRVGRQKPGLVFTLYNQNRSRDRSHFESFRQYHQAIYRFVEPTSVTPYSFKCRERALPGLIIGTARHILGMKGPAEILEFETEIYKKLENYISQVEKASLSHDARSEIKTQIDLIIKKWKKIVEDAEGAQKQIEWGSIIPRGENIALLEVFGQVDDPDDYDRIGMMTSMRNVDSNATIRVVS